MMNALSVEAINQHAPYHVEKIDNREMYTFVSDTGVELIIGFMKDVLITSAPTYQLAVSNVNNKRSPRDKKVKQTTYAILTEFFEKNQAALLYICQTGDGKQQARHRLFSFWFDRFELSIQFTCLTTAIADEEGVYNAATLLIRNDNPQLAALMSEFNDTAILLREKP